MCRMLIHKYNWQDCGHSFLYRDSCRYNNNMICPLDACDTYLETFEEKCEVCWERDKYLAEEREKAERREELANIERQLELEMEIEQKRELLGVPKVIKWMWNGLLILPLAKLRRESVEKEKPDEREEDPGQVVKDLQELQEDAKKDLEDVEMEDAPLDREEIRSGQVSPARKCPFLADDRQALENIAEVFPQYHQKSLEHSPNSSTSPPARRTPE
ncbi:hypothetical protein HYFRA_00009023 [Hymenoscyphus fraxineus]|uniref:Uncharacterized protein n=1 Tax=Hymenoscyphus fraxineus TaxID=746836 RepID=A0A9N9PRU7_9HELO|nr:hypothetical protein HYFRA_00009023 [Hymenoscyphus fraxineus]